MVKIGIDARLTYYRVGGISTYIRRLVRALETLDFDNEYTVFSSRKATEKLTNRFSESKLWTPSHHRLERGTLSLELLPRRLDIFHSTDFIPPFRGAKRHVINIYDLTFLHYPHHKDATSRRYYNNQINRAVNQADHILTISEASKRDIIDMLGIDPKKITVHLLGVDERFRPISPDDLAEWRGRLSLPAKYILFVSTLEPRKNIPTLLDAYADLPKQLRDEYPLLLVGRPGWLFDGTNRRIEELRARNFKIIIRSDIHDDALPAVYNMAEVTVLPSFYEGFGIPPLESMACGTPPIVSNVSSLPEVVGEVGFLIDPNDPSTLTTALNTALNNYEWRLTMREAGLERAKQFTWDRAAQTARDVYQMVL